MNHDSSAARWDENPVDPNSPEAERAARFAERVMGELQHAPGPSIEFPSVEDVLAGLSDQQVERSEVREKLESANDELRPSNEFELRRGLLEVQAGLDPEISRARLEKRLGRGLDELLRDGIELPKIFDTNPNGRNAFRAVFGRPEALPSIPAVKEFLETTETQAPGWLWARVQAELETSRVDDAGSEVPVSAPELPSQPVAESEPIRASHWTGSWRVWSAVAALFVAATWVWSFAGGPVPFGSSEADPWTVRERDDSANTNGLRFVEAKRPFTNYRSMASIVEDIQDGTPR